MSADLNEQYKKLQKKVQSAKTYKDAKSQYNDAKKQAGEAFEKTKSDVTTNINEVKEQTKRFKKEVKNQFEQLLDINNLTGGKGGNSIKYIKKLLVETLKNIEPKISEIMNQEVLNAIGCDQQQEFSGQTLYIKVKSIDIINLLKIDPESKEGKVLYERFPIQVQTPPFSMNRELYLRIQNNPTTYFNQYGQYYLGISGQPLFDIQFTEFDNFGQSGPWYKITLLNRVSGVNKVGEFLTDYYKTIKIVEFKNILASIMESLSGAFSISLNVGLVQVEDATKFQLLIQRILGLCFDNKSEIDVSGVSKIAPLDGLDESFFEFTSIDLRNLDQRLTNIKNGVIQFEDCGNVKLPVDYQAIINSLDNLNFISGASETTAGENITNSLTNNPEWQGLAIDGNINAAVDLDFVKLIMQGLIISVFSPKVLLPIFIMLKSLGNDLVDAITGYMDFIRQFKKYVVNFASKVGALFVQELFKLIKRDIVQLIQQIIADVAKEKAAKKYVMILKLIQILLVVAELISDWRKCKSVVDELLALFNILTTGWGGEVPLPLLYASQILDGYSESRAFLNVIEELQSIGIPTGPLPDGSPNLELLSKFAQMKGMAMEQAENGKVQVAVGPLTITPAGLTVPASAFGKGF